MGMQSKIRKNQRRKINRKNKTRFFEQKCLEINRPTMEDLIVNAKEHNILKKYCKRLQERFNVQIRMPKTTSLDSDVIFVSIEGLDSNREYVKRFLAEKMKELSRNPTPDKDCVASDKDCVASDKDCVASNKDCVASNKNDVDVVTLSDSESESEDISVISLEKFKRRDDSVCIVNCSTNSPSLENIAACEQPKRNKRKAENMKVNSHEVSSFEASDLNEVSSTTGDDMVSKKARLSESVIIIEEHGTCSMPAEEFIPLISGNKPTGQKNESANETSCSKSKNSNGIDDSIIIIDEPHSTLAPRQLRPVVIDGSNVAMEHGKSSRTFSVKGIKLAIDYFLNRGHTQVTAFVPKFRKSKNPNRSVPTTDVDDLDDLERKQQVVFTPSRRVNGRNINSYDDRFIVQLAASNGGVIVSNDNYRDLLTENESFKEAIEQRLLMFCFVGDVFMVPDDPLGRNGPKLDDFLSFPPKDQNDKN